MARLDRAREPEAQLLHAARDVQRPGAVAEVPLDLADDRRHRVGRELDAALGVEALDREQQADRADLDEVLERLPAARVARGEAAHERQVALDDAVAGARVAGAVGLQQVVQIVAFAFRQPSRSSALMSRAADTWRSTRVPSRRPSSETSSTSRVSTRETPGSASGEPAKGPSRTRSPSGAAVASSVTALAASSCTSRLSTASSRSSTRSTGSSKRETSPPSTSRPDAAVAVAGRELDDDAVDGRRKRR